MIAPGEETDVHLDATVRFKRYSMMQQDWSCCGDTCGVLVVPWKKRIRRVDVADSAKKDVRLRKTVHGL